MTLRSFFRGYGEPLALALLVSTIVFSLGTAYTAWGNAVSLSVTVNTALTFTTTTDNFSTINPGTVVFASTTMRVATNDTSGYFVILSGDNKTSSVNNLISGSNSISDQTEWIPATATTSAGNAVRISSFANSGNVLAFRVMTASGTVDMKMPTWWGTTDNYTDTATTLWAGIASSTVSRKIVNTGTGSYSASDHLGTVNYYLNVSATQPTGAYTAPLTYTATGN